MRCRLGSTAHRAGVLLLAGACAWFGVLALARPERLAERCGVSEDAMRVMGARDVGSALLLALSRDPRLPLLARVAFDANDAVVVGRRRPAVAAMAAAFGIISALLAVSAPRRAKQHTA